MALIPTTRAPQRRTRARAIPKGYTTVSPCVISRDTAKLIEFMRTAFDAQQIAVEPAADGTIAHAEMRIGDTVIMMFDGRENWIRTPAFLRLCVEDVDAMYERALKAGATSVSEPTDLPYGERVGRVRDPVGNIWWMQTHVEDVSAEDAAERSRDARYAEAVAYVEMSLVQAMPKQQGIGDRE